MTIPLNDTTVGLLFIAALAVIVLAFVVETTFSIAFDHWTQRRKPRPERPRFPWTDRTGT
jgi:hypothetical protein